MMTNLAVFVSGSGTNCENIICYFQESERARVVLVVSNRADAFALVRATRLGVPTCVVSKEEFADSSRMLALLREHSVDFIVLAGFLLMVPPYLVRAYQGRMVNIHPSLLPKYGGKGLYGHHVHEAVWQARETVTGITIHWVNEEYDQGAVIRQFTTPVLPDDTPDDIAAHIHELEQQHFPKVIESVLP